MILNEIPRACFDRFMPRPRDGFSSYNLRNNFLSLASCDFLPLRAITAIVVETHDVGSNAAAAALYSGTGVTVTAEKTYQYQGIACIKAVVDATDNRQILRATLSEAKDLSDFVKLGIWTRCNAASSAIQFIIRDSLGNESYWNITTNGTADTWEQAFITLASPDSNNGTPADLTDVVSYGYKGLDASAEYLFDEITAFVWAMKIWIEPSYIGGYFYPVYAASDRVKFAGGFTATIIAPSVNPRIDLISITSAGVLQVTTGSEVASPDYDDIPECPEGNIPLYAVYLPVTATKIVEYHHKDAYPDDGYIYADLRPWVGGGSSDISVRGTFTNTDLSSGKLTITHNKGLSAPYPLLIQFFDNNGKEVKPDIDTAGANAHIYDFSPWGAISGTWGYVYL